MKFSLYLLVYNFRLRQSRIMYVLEHLGRHEQLAKGCKRAYTLDQERFRTFRGFILRDAFHSTISVWFAFFNLVYRSSYNINATIYILFINGTFLFIES